MALDSDRVEKPVRKLRKLIKKVSRRSSPKDVHDLRTQTRRLEATLGALSLDGKRNGRRLLKQLSKVRKRAGKVRDMDVLTSYAAHLNANGDKECEVELLEHLGNVRQRKADNLESSVAKHGKPLRSRLKRTLAELDSVVGENAGQDNRKSASSQVAATALSLESELAGTRHLGRQNLHPYRLKVKELRNVLKLSGNGTAQEFVDELGRVKDLIGEWHDWEELLTIASKTLDHEPSCQLLRELKRTTSAKYERALDETERVRKKYLGIPGARRKRGSGKVSEAARKAAAEIAA